MAPVEFDFSYAGAECNRSAIEEAFIAPRITGGNWGTLREVAQQIAAHAQNSATMSFE
jgi:hypothetical protein